MESKKDKEGWLSKLNPFRGDAAAVSKIQYRASALPAKTTSQRPGFDA